VFSVAIESVFIGLTLMVSVVVFAHCPGSGVNVYVVVTKLFTVDGDQLPEIFSSRNNRKLMQYFLQYKYHLSGNVGVICCKTVISIVVGITQTPATQA